jgi:hypothetical protein
VSSRRGLVRRESEGCCSKAAATKNQLKLNHPMKSKFTSLLCATLFAATSMLHGADAPQAKKSSPEFERIKSLAGTWKGKVDIGHGPEDLTVEYRVIAAGSAVEERTFPGTPNEMVTMYYDKDGKLALTHYCMLGNRPAMSVKSSDAKTISFQLDQACGIDCAKESHMNAVTLRFDDADTLTTTCKALIEGKDMPEKATILKRIATR